MKDPKARKTISKLMYSLSTVNRVLTEKQLYGKVVDGSSPRFRKSIFQSLNLNQRDQIRKTVSVLSVEIEEIYSHHVFAKITSNQHISNSQCGKVL